MNITRPVLPISKDDFLKMLQKCRPPSGWPKTIAVANSGGPDSTCLLFLINRCLVEKKFSTPDRPNRVVSLTVDHALQPSSSAMAEHCTTLATSLGIKHLTSRIPWSEPPFPKRPQDGEMFENTARLARYHLLFKALTITGADTLAFGHHADDQLETSLMRLARGTTEIGAGGMRHCRRWGMGMGGGEGSLAWTGHEGMNRWIIRPLLDVSKDRILATCEQNGLEYITDKTNFQPHITLRNAIRHMLTSPENRYQVVSENKSMPPDIIEKLSAMEKAVSSLQAVSVDVSDSIGQLRGAVKMLTTQVEDIDSQVDSHLHRSTLPSPPGTYLISIRGLSAVRDELVRAGMVLRIMRYVSFHPWGSIRADGNRRRKSIDQIIDKIWKPNPFASGIKMFVAGGGVLWTPVLLKGDKIKVHIRVNESGVQQGDTLGWLASRQPPLHKAKMEEKGMTNPLQLDVTKLLTAEMVTNAKNKSRRKVLEVLYDCRFLLRFNIARMPEEIAKAITTDEEEKILVQPSTRWYWPKVVWQRKQMDDVTLQSEIVDQNDCQPKLWSGKTSRVFDHRQYWNYADEVISCGWIEIDWIRSLSAI